MKRFIFILIAALVSVFGFSACADNQPSGETVQPPSGTHTPDKDGVTLDSEILVVYFSCTQNTEKIAEYIIGKTGGARYKIQPKIPYTEADLKYYTNGRADKEQADPTARPEIDGAVENMAKYKTVFIGYPIWHGQAPKIIYTFLESYDFSGKMIIPFCTSGSSPVGTSAANLHSLANGANWFDGVRFDGNASEREVFSWVEGLGILNEPAAEDKLYLTVGNTTLTATLAENSSAEALKKLLADGPLTIEMSDYANFEKVGSLGTDLPTNDERITTQAGDLILYLGNRFVIYYDTNSWSFTRLGRIDGITQDGLMQILGEGDVTVVLSLTK